MIQFDHYTLLTLWGSNVSRTRLAIDEAPIADRTPRKDSVAVRRACRRSRHRTHSEAVGGCGARQWTVVQRDRPWGPAATGNQSLRRSGSMSTGPQGNTNTYTVLKCADPWTQTDFTAIIPDPGPRYCRVGFVQLYCSLFEGKGFAWVMVRETYKAIKQYSSSLVRKGVHLLEPTNIPPSPYPPLHPFPSFAEGFSRMADQGCDLCESYELCYILPH